MRFMRNSNLKNCHATFGASKHSWLRYDQEKMVDAILSQYRKSIGTDIHEYAAQEIILGHKKTNIRNVKSEIESYIYQKYNDNDKDDITLAGKRLMKMIGYLSNDVFETIKCYINDGIGFKMDTEIPLEYSELFFGTVDCISFNKNFLRIHDLKTGTTPASIEQLLVYAAFFCLQYKYNPNNIDIELRIYQNNEIVYHNPEGNEIECIMDKIVNDNEYITKLAVMEV